VVGVGTHNILSNVSEKIILFQHFHTFDEQRFPSAQVKLTYIAVAASFGVVCLIKDLLNIRSLKHLSKVIRDIITLL